MFSSEFDENPFAYNTQPISMADPDMWPDENPVDTACLSCGERERVPGCLQLCLECFAAFEDAEEAMQRETYFCTIADPPDPEPMVLHGTYAECVAYAAQYAADDWPFAVIRHITGQLVHLGEGYAYHDDDEGFWNGIASY